MKKTLVAAALLAFSTAVLAAGNTTNEDFRQAKKLLEKKVYFDHRVTLYCGYDFDKNKHIDLPAGFSTAQHKERAPRVEWEHVVPAENFGRYFPEWREGDARCVTKKGKAFKGRKCAEEASQAYRFMQADMYNLFPAVGAVNALRLNYNYAMLPEAPASFGTCEMKIQNRRAEPPQRARGEIARATLYMAEAYESVYRLSDQQRKLMEAWNQEYPVQPWECVRAARIEKLQGNRNDFVVDACRRAGYAYQAN